MTRLAIAGATGSIGRLVAAAAESRDYTVVNLSRSNGVDLVNSTVLEGLLTTCAAVIDCSDVSEGTKHPERFVPACRHLLDAAKAQGCKRYVMLSIDGVEKDSLQVFPFYKARFEQEGVALSSSTTSEGIECIVVRSVQWYEFAMNPVAAIETSDAGDGSELVKVQDWALQPAAIDSLAKYLLDVAIAPQIPASTPNAAGHHEETARQGKACVVVIAGPERMSLVDMIRRFLEARKDTREVVADEPVLPTMGQGALYAPEGSATLKLDLTEWLQT